jgi:hypothetical protein
MRLGASCTLSIVFAATLVASAGQGPQGTAERSRVEPSEVLGRFLASNQHSLLSYEATRKLEVVARGGKMNASLTARTTLDPVTGFRYEILEESGSGMLRSRVLKGVLEAERQAKTREQGRSGALSDANYSFGTGEFTTDGLLRVSIKPKRKEELLMDGSILLSSGDADLVEMEGLLVKRPSFWTRKVRIVRRYARIGGARVPVTTSSTADVLFAGPSTFLMRYEYQSINGAPVSEADRETPSALKSKGW